MRPMVLSDLLYRVADERKHHKWGNEPSPLDTMKSVQMSINPFFFSIFQCETLCLYSKCPTLITNRGDLVSVLFFLFLF